MSTSKMHSRMRPKYKPTVNGREVDLDLLYQIVTSRGGWEKVNMRNEWDDLLEHFHLPRGTNGGLVIKQIYLKYLENYEKVYFLGEDGGHKNDDDEYDYFRNRRTASKMTSRSSTAAASTPSSSNPQTGQGQSQSIPLSDAAREQLGLPKRAMSDYDKLILSLQSPLPNEQDMAISVCTLLCNETKHVIRLSKCPSLLSYLVAHTGVYRDCGLREVIEETYRDGRGMNLGKFWEDIYVEPEAKSLLCEAYVKRIQSTLGLEEEPVFKNNVIEICESSEEGDPDPEDTIAAIGLSLEEECDPISFSNLETSTTPPEGDASQPSSPTVLDGTLNDAEEKPPSPTEPIPISLTLPMSPSEPAEPRPPSVAEDPVQLCCQLCPCYKSSLGATDVDDENEYFSPPSTLARSHSSDDKESKRVHQIALILRNLSFEEDNAEVMAQNVTMLRFLLLTANCKFGSLMQNSLDTISNVAKYFTLQDPSKDPISSILLSSIISGLFSEDRLKIICSLDTIRNLTRAERNEKILANLMEKKVCDRLCELLTLCDIMLLIYTLECIHAITGIGESVCNEIVRVKGSISSFIALVTVEAQSYGPKGCIQMRVVETYTGGVHGSTGISQAQSNAVALSSAQSTTSLQVVKPVAPPTTTTNSIQAIGLRTVTGQTVVPPPPQQQATGFANSPSPLCGTVAAISVSAPVSSQLRVQQQQPTLRISPEVISPPTSTPAPMPSGGGQAFQVLHPHSSSPLSPSLQPRPASPAPQIAQLQGKPNCLPPLSHHSNSHVANNHESTTTTTVSYAQHNNVNHVHGKSIQMSSATTTTTNAGAPPQISSQSLTQQLFTPCISSENMTEEAWATAWVKGGFDQLSGTSIEEGELYRMYCVARKKPPASLLSQSQLIQCIKLVYGASIGPVMKSFGSTSLSFVEGVRPKISFQQTNSVPVLNSLPTSASSDMPVSVATNGVINDGAHNNNTCNAIVSRPTTPVSSAHHGSSPLSPILKATLSRPPTPKSPSGKQKSKVTNSKGRKDKDSSIPKLNSIKKKSKRGAASTLLAKQQPPGKILTPSSSAIRSLLASKVAQRQQKKLQQEAKNSNKTKGSPVKMNGDASLEKGDESSASSSMNSIEETESKTDPSTLTFQGMLCNGSGDPSKEEEQMEIDGVFDDLANNAKVKGMLVDLLERKVSHKDAANGIVGREIRISDKGLELVQNQNSTELDDSLMNETLGTASGESQEPQKMTFYASPEVVVAEQKCTTVNVVEVSTPTSTSESTILLRGGGGDSETTALNSSQVVVQSESVGIISGDGGGASSSGGGDGYNDVAIVDSNGASSGGGNDLFEKFSQFSDLIVVNPEQLGIGVKRQASTSENNTEDSDAPPPKKIAICMNGNDDSRSGSETPPPPNPHVPVTNSGSVLQNALSATQTSHQVIKTSTGHDDGGLIAVATTSNGNNVVLHVPVTLLNAPTPQHISFGDRQIVIQGGQIVVSGGSQATAGLQGQVSVSKPSGSSGDAIPKAYILVPQHLTTATQLNLQQISATSGQNARSSSTDDPIQGVLSQIADVRKGIPPSMVNHLSMELLDQEIPFLCEWAGCGYRFVKHQQVYIHAVATHCPGANNPEAIRCEWGANGCDPLMRKQFSVMTHLLDRHCSKQALDLACYRRKNKIEPPPPPQQPAHHPGYAPNAAFHAIKRHALQYMNPKDIVEENEGPVTKSIRLTSALILRNLVNFSPQGRRSIAAHESQLATIAMSSAESSRTISQLLFDMSESSDN